MVRFIIIGVVLAIAFTLYTLVDAAMSDSSRARGVPKPVWVLITILIPVIGGFMWLTVGKGDGRPAPTVRAPDDDPRFGDLSPDETDKRIAELEQQLLALDDEVFPGELTNDKPQDKKSTDKKSTDKKGSDEKNADKKRTDEERSGSAKPDDTTHESTTEEDQSGQ